MKLHVVVTQEDIDKGRGQSSYTLPFTCPLALAGTRALHEAGHKGAVSVGVRSMTHRAAANYDEGAKKLAVGTLPTVAYDFRCTFDSLAHTAEVKPFEFDIELVPEEKEVAA